MQDQPTAPPDFTNPLEKEIFELQQLYASGLAAGKTFEALKPMRIKIKILKSDLATGRGEDN